MNLLTKRKALARSIELEMREAILNHVSTLHTKVDQLRSEIKRLANVKDNGDEELYGKFESTYPSEDEDIEEEEEDDSYIGTYNNDDDDEKTKKIIPLKISKT
ncbi:hypothetical protein LguiB_003194 [Lonicera macranthoides]